MPRGTLAAWPRAELGGLFRVKHGYAFKGEYFGDRGHYIVLTPGNFHEEGGFKLKDGKEKYYSAEPPGDYVLRRGDLIVAMTEQAEGLLGSSAQIPEDGKFLHNQRLGLVVDLKEDRLDKSFLYYLFNSRNVRHQIRATATGLKIRHTAPERIGRVTVALPPLLTQQRIGAILSAYDHLIENNSRRIKILEEMARRVYEQWFVRLQFPGHEAARMARTKLGMMPDLWQVRPIGDVVETLGGATPSSKSPEFWNGDITWFTPTDLTKADAMFVFDSERAISRSGLAHTSARVFPAYSVMMTSRATIGVIALNSKPACTNQGFITSIPNEWLSAYHIYYWILHNLSTIDAIASGATYKEINRTEFRSLLVAVPDRQTEERFREIVEPMAKEIEALLRKNTNLRRGRDLLLPKLISGDLDVSDLDIPTEATV